MKIACVSSTEPGGIDRLLSDVADQLQAVDASLVGIVKATNYTSSFENRCDMKVRVLPEGPVIKITQDLGKGSDACRLDPGAIANAVLCVEASSFDQADLFILNKFGPEEAAGRGFCNVIGTALEQGLPVLVGVGAANKLAFDTFAGDLAVTLPDDAKAILDWYDGPQSTKTAG
ncbi:MAG: DUF2478 domain-containing protein [Rhizobiaceae bacterium]